MKEPDKGLGHSDTWMTLLDYYEYLVYNRECLDMLFLLENVYEVESGSMNDY